MNDDDDDDAVIDMRDLISMGWLGRERFGEAETGKLQLAPGHYDYDDGDYVDASEDVPGFL